MRDTYLIKQYQKYKDKFALLKPKTVHDFVVDPKKVWVNLIKVEDHTGEACQRAISASRLRELRPVLDLVLQRDTMHLLRVSKENLAVGDGQARCTLIKERGVPRKTTAKIYTLDDLVKADLPIAVWVRLVSSDGNWKLPDFLMIEASLWKDHFRSADIDPVYVAKNSILTPQALLRAYQNAQHIKNKLWPPSGSPPPRVLHKLWHNCPPDALDFCRSVRWWLDLTEKTVTDPKTRKHCQTHHRWFTFAYALWTDPHNQNEIDGLAKFLLTSSIHRTKYWDGRMVLARRGGSVRDAFTQTLEDLNYKRIGHYLQILGTTGV